MRKLTVVIPVYNEQETIHEVVERVCAVDLGSIEKEIVISDDGSTDSTPAAIENSRNAHAEIVRVYTSPTNLGKGAAVRLGMSLAKGDVIIIQDADLELDPAEYSRILDPFLTHSADVVYGSRFARHTSRISARTRWANRFLTTLTNLLFSGHLTDMETAYKAFRREVIQKIRLRCVRFDFEPEITAKLLRAGYAIHEVPISYNPRSAAAGKKISWVDGIEAIYTLLRCRFVDSQ
ncbi:MAG: glycosyltransferase family 2 protein [Chloroflexota bacterium]|nr:glycosyltransferase family 2 protein [Chloroflexota bacterium]